MKDDQEVVEVTSTTAALSGPNFVIEKDGKLYLAAAVLEYDPNGRELDDDQREAINLLSRLFEEAYREAPLRAAVVQRRRRVMALNSGPGLPRPK